ncbi:armadillo-type protein [Kockovaella imperatae]|uniref:Armadillo-type protein n=1 Tax=Kockovaella imperatae TaxID=4999 RepID=A0A1Y1UR28_9TREE|nr:armadillo-type protein [Kockovaella imperatae]ORX40511.1 armadillo-type protein [Kockovaella imperatae]
MSVSESLPERVREDIGTIKSSHYNDVNLLTALDRTANALRNAHYRLLVGEMAIASALTQILSRCVKDGETRHSAQVGRVVANLVADCDPNRDLMVGAGYISAVIEMLGSHPSLDCARPLVASLLNLTMNDHDAALNQLADWTAITSLLEIGHENADDMLAQWSADITTKVVEKHSEALAKSVDSAVWDVLLRPMHCFIPPFKDDLAESTIFILRAACEILELLPIYVLRYPPIDVLTNFVERGDVPKWDADGEEDPAKLLSDAKEATITALSEMASGLDEDNTLWEVMRAWLSLSDREDLTICALLCYGNYAQDNAKAESLVQGTNAIMEDVLSLLIATTPAKVQHALFGMLRNLSISPSNKKYIGDHAVIERVVSMRPWVDERDLVGSVQGGAIGLIKNLCRDNGANAKRFLGTDQTSLLALMTRTDDQALRFEATRIYVNVIRSLSQQGEVAKVNDQVIGYLSEMIRLGHQLPVLINEGIIALTLISTFTPAKASLVAAVLEDKKTGDGPDSALDVLRSLMQSSSEDTQGIRENCKVLAEQLTLLLSDNSAKPIISGLINA